MSGTQLLKRGRKRKQTDQQQNTLLDMGIKVTNVSQERPDVIAKSILNELIDNLVLPGPKKQDGSKVTKKTLDEWCKAYPWLQVNQNESHRRLMCAVCTQYKMTNVFAHEGSPNIQKSSLERHNESAEHCAAERMNDSDPDYNDCDASNEKLDALICKEDLCLFRTVYAVAKNEGPSDFVNVMLETESLNGSSTKYKNLSWTTINEIQTIIAQGIRRKVVDELKESEFFAIMIDESTDITVDKRLSICVRYVMKGVSKTEFLANVPLTDGKSHTVTHAVMNCLAEHEIDMTKCVSLATDGASVMLGKKTGVGVQLKSKSMPFVVQTHCFAHRLNLAIMDSIKKDDTLKKFREMFESLYHWMSSSNNRTGTLKRIQSLLHEPELTIKDPHTIRWLGLRNAVEAVYEGYASVLATLSKFAEEKDAAAKGLFKYFSSYKSALLIAFMLDIHEELAILSKNLQSNDMLFSEVAPLIDATLGNLEHLKTHDGAGLLI